MILRVAFVYLSIVLTGYAQSSDSKTGTDFGLSFWALEAYKRILLSSEVASDLRLSPQQRSRLEPIIRRKNSTCAGLRVSGIQKDYHDIRSILNSDQRFRFEQLLLQRIGALRALLMPDIQAGLKLTATQQESLEQLKELYSSGVKNLNEFEILHLGTTYSQGKYSSPLSKAADRMAESVLTAKQILEWRGLTGSPLDPTPKYW